MAEKKQRKSPKDSRDKTGSSEFRYTEVLEGNSVKWLQVDLCNGLARTLSAKSEDALM